MEEYKRELEELDHQHNPEDVPEFGSHVPDNKYQARLDQIFVSRSKKENMQTVMVFEILVGDFIFRKETKYCQMATSENLDYLTLDLRKLGVPASFKWNELETIFPKLLDAKVELLVKTKGEFTNIYINKKLETVDSGVNNTNKDVPF